MTRATPNAVTNLVDADASTNAPAPEALRDIVDPVSILDLRQLLLAATLGLVVAALAAWLFRLWWRRRQRRLAELPPGPPPLPPHERARRRLEDALRRLGDPDAFCTEVSLVLREYVEERFEWNAPDRTSEEFLALVGDRPELIEEHKLLLRDFLGRCDAVKFARYDPTEAELREIHRAAVRFVADTIPLPAPIAPAAPIQAATVPPGS